MDEMCQVFIVDRKNVDRKKDMIDTAGFKVFPAEMSVSGRS
jgi:hypothetical protein